MSNPRTIAPFLAVLALSASSVLVAACSSDAAPAGPADGPDDRDLLVPGGGGDLTRPGDGGASTGDLAGAIADLSGGGAAADLALGPPDLSMLPAADGGAPVAPQPAPPCPPNVMKITMLNQITDADRLNGRVVPDVGMVPAGGALAADPLQNGTFRAVTRGAQVPRPMGDQGGALAGTIYFPSMDGAAVAPGKFPLVMVMPGFGAQHGGYSKYSNHLATYGFIVLGIDTASGLLTSDHAREAAQVVNGVSWMLGAGPLAASIDGTKIAAAGHSKGGKLAFWAASLDPRIDMVIGWDPSNAGGPPCFIDATGCNSQPAAPNCNNSTAAASGILHRMKAESLTLGVPPDNTNPEAAHNALNFYRGAPSPATFVPLKGAHADFVTGGFGGGNTKLHNIVMRSNAGLLLQRLRGVTVDAKYLPGGAAYDPDMLQNGAVRSK